MGIAAATAVYFAGDALRSSIEQSPFAFLRLISTAQDPLPSLVGFLGYFVPLIAIALGFDAINSELNRRTLSRVLAQPVYRDAVLIGKIVGGLTTLALVLVGLWLLVTGFGIFYLGIAPSGEEIVRGLLYLLVTLLYAGVWLTLGVLLSIVFRQPATSALAALGSWILFTVLWPIVTQAAVQLFAPLKYGTAQEQFAQIKLSIALNRVSPNGLYSESIEAILLPETRSLGPVTYSQMEWALPGNPLPVSESIMLVSPQMLALAAAILVLFAACYVLFQRREIRA